MKKMQNTREINIGEYNYPLPDERIAKFPLPVRDQSKLLIYKNGEIKEDHFFTISSYLPEDSLLVFNNTKVIQARFHFRKETGALIEIFCLEPLTPADYVLAFQQTQQCRWLCMVGNLKKWKEGKLKSQALVKGESVTLWASRGESVGTGYAISFEWDNSNITFADILDSFGELPIPPYLNRDTEDSDLETYQTVYSKIKGSVAAPTAGLHFTEQVFQELNKKKIQCEELTLHVGAGTFKPVKSEILAGHEMHTEYIAVRKSTIETLISRQGKAIAVGTTSVRTLESLYFLGCLIHQNPQIEEKYLHVTQWQSYDNQYDLSVIEALKEIILYLQRNGLDTLKASTQIMIAPGYNYRIVNAMITNFHQPKSTLLLLVSAFTKGKWREIYEYALNHDFRFLSYGDSSLLFND